MYVKLKKLHATTGAECDNGELLVLGMSVGAELQLILQKPSLPSAPSFVEASSYDVLDARISSHWRVREPLPGKRTAVPASYLFAVEAWANDPHFYDKLVDGDDAVRPIWRRWQDILEAEFAPPSVQREIAPFEGNWLLCEACSEAWMARNGCELQVCPNCSQPYRLQGFGADGRAT